MAESNSSLIDFGGALQLMRAGMSVKRAAWDKKALVKRKYSIRISASGDGFETMFLNYASDRAVLQPEDLLAKDWVEVTQ